MKAGHNAIYTLVMIILCLCFGVSETRAQEPMKITGRVTVINKTAERTDTLRQFVYYGLFGDMAAAKKAIAKIEASRNMQFNAKTFREYCMKNGFPFQTKGNGTFTTTTIPGKYIVAVTKEADLPKMEWISNYVVRAGQTHYNLVIESQELKGVTTTVERPKPVIDTFDPGDGTVIFAIKAEIPKDSIMKSTRIVVQPYAVDCMREDTMAYLPSIVYEGDFYHALQDKRMSFDYFQNDTLGKSYRSSVIKNFQDLNPVKEPHTKLNKEYLKLDTLRMLEEAKADDKKRLDSIPLVRVGALMNDDSLGIITVNASIKYKLPNKDSLCRGAYTCTLEDYHRVYYKKLYPGTCLIKRPFKFMDFTAGIPDMELDSRFYEPAESQYTNVTNSLDLRFLQGKAELAKDSVNDEELEKMRDILSKQEGLLKQSVTIVATSSPEGGDKINQDLAQKRAVVAKQLVSRFISGVSPNTKTKLYTWKDVAERLAMAGKRVEAQKVLDLIDANGSNKPALDRAMRELEFYQDAVEPIMARMRLMSYTYKFETNHVMNPAEAVASYYTYKKDYIEGKKVLSSGDYYNLYESITDTLELDTITTMAYNNLLKNKLNDPSQLYNERIAPYVLNRMARKLLDNGTPDTTLLMPFIDEPLSDTIMDKEIDRVRPMLDAPEVCMNFHDILITQAMNYYQMQMFHRAHKYIGWLKSKMTNKVPDALIKIQMYMDLMANFGNNEDDPAFVRAKDSIMKSSPDNMAILYTEVPRWREPSGDKDKAFEKTNDLLDLMDDDNPKKWYLKGMLWAEKADILGGEEDMSAYEKEEEGFHLKSPEEEEALALSNAVEYELYEAQKKAYLEAHKDEPIEEPVDYSETKHYLAYMHHCFKLGGSSFRQFYFTEGAIDEDMRKKYLYLKKDFPAYEKLFTLLKVRDDENRKLLRGEDDDEEPEKSNDVTGATPTISTNGDNTADTDASASEKKEEDTKE